MVSDAPVCISPTLKVSVLPLSLGCGDLLACGSSSHPQEPQEVPAAGSVSRCAHRGEAKSSWRRLVGVESKPATDCRSKLSTHKMLFIVNSEDYIPPRTLLPGQAGVLPCPNCGLGPQLVGGIWALRSSPWPLGVPGPPEV